MNTFDIKHAQLQLDSRKLQIPWNKTHTKKNANKCFQNPSK